MRVAQLLDRAELGRSRAQRGMLLLLLPTRWFAWRAQLSAQPGTALLLMATRWRAAWRAACGAAWPWAALEWWGRYRITSLGIGAGSGIEQTGYLKRKGYTSFPERSETRPQRNTEIAGDLASISELRKLSTLSSRETQVTAYVLVLNQKRCPCIFY